MGYIMASSQVGQNTLRALATLSVKDFMIDGTHIKGRECGIAPEELFHVAKNIYSKEAKDFIGRQFIGRQFGNLQSSGDTQSDVSKIEPRNSVDIYASSPALTPAPQESNDKVTNNSSSISFMISRDIKLAQLTQNEEFIPVAMNYFYSCVAGTMSPNNFMTEEPLEVLGGKIQDETDQQAQCRELNAWIGAVRTINNEMGEAYLEQYATHMTAINSMLSISGFITTRWGLGKDTAASLGYSTSNYRTSSSKLLDLLSTKDKSVPRCSSIVLQRHGKQYSIVSQCATLSVSGFITARWGLGKDTASSLGYSTSSSKLLCLLSPKDNSVPRCSTTTATASAESFDFAELEGTPHCKVFVPTKSMPASRIPVDAVVNFTDPQLTMSPTERIAKEIVKTAGTPLKTECKKLANRKDTKYFDGKCPIGEVVTTSAGNLRDRNGATKIIVHASIMDKKMQKTFSSSDTHTALQSGYNQALQATLNFNKNCTNSTGKIHTILIPPLEDVGSYDRSISTSRCISGVKKYLPRLKEENITVIMCFSNNTDAQNAKESIEHQLAEKDK